MLLNVVHYNNNNKNFGPTSPGVARDSFFLFILFISFILLIEFNFVLTFLKDARERGAHDDCQSPLPGQVGPGLTVERSNGAAQCAIVRSIRARTTSHDLDGRSKKPKQARAKSAKRSKNQTNPENRKEQPCGPCAVTSQCRIIK